MKKEKPQEIIVFTQEQFISAIKKAEEGSVIRWDECSEKPTYNPITGKYYTLLHRNPPKREKEVQLWQKPRNLKKKTLLDLMFGDKK